MMEPSIAQRGEENAEGKTAIAREAARMVADAGSVLIDSGTTTAALTQELVGRPGLTVFTNSLNHAVTLCRVSGNRVIMLGGEVDNNDEATFGTGTATGIDSVRADIAFIGVGGFAEDGGMTDYSITAAETRGKMIWRAAPICWRTRPSSPAGRRSACQHGQMRRRDCRPHAGPALAGAWTGLAGRSSSQNRSWYFVIICCYTWQAPELSARAWPPRPFLTAPAPSSSAAA